MNFAQPLSAATFVSAAVNVVFPWSMCPIVPTFTCGLDRSNFSFAIEVRSVVFQSAGLHTSGPGLRSPFRTELCIAGSTRQDLAYTVHLQRRAGLALKTHRALLRPLDPRHDLFAHARRRLLVPIEVHRVGRAALRSRPEVGGVSEHLRE